MHTAPDREDLSVPSSMHCHSSGSEEGLGDSCLPENRAIEPYASSTPVLAQTGRLGQAIGSDCSDLQRSKESGSAMVPVKQGLPASSCKQLRHNLKHFHTTQTDLFRPAPRGYFHIFTQYQKESVMFGLNINH